MIFTSGATHGMGINGRAAPFKPALCARCVPAKLAHNERKRYVAGPDGLRNPRWEANILNVMRMGCNSIGAAQRVPWRSQCLHGDLQLSCSATGAIRPSKKVFSGLAALLATRRTKAT